MYNLEIINVRDSGRFSFTLTVVFSVLNLYFRLSDIFSYLNIKDWSVFTRLYVSELRYFSTFNIPDEKIDVATLFIPVNSLHMLLQLVVQSDSVKYNDLLEFIAYIESRWKTIFHTSVNLVLKNRDSAVDTSNQTKNYSVEEILAKNEEYLSIQAKCFPPDLVRALDHLNVKH